MKPVIRPIPSGRSGRCPLADAAGAIGGIGSPSLPRHLSAALPGPLAALRGPAMALVGRAATLVGRATAVLGPAASRAGLAAALAGLATASPAQAADIRLLAATAVKEPVLAAVPAFEAATGHHVVATWTGTDGITRRINAGELFDVVIVGGGVLDQLAQAGHLVPESRQDYAKAGVGVAVRSGAPRPDIRSGAAVRQAVLDARSVAYSTGASGQYVAELFKRWGIAEQVQPKLRQPATGAAVGELLARGEADLGFQQVSELLHAPGIDYLGPLPPDIQNTTVYAAGLHRRATEAQAAQAFIRALAAPASDAFIRGFGMEPGR